MGFGSGTKGKEYPVVMYVPGIKRWDAGHYGGEYGRIGRKSMITGTGPREEENLL